MYLDHYGLLKEPFGIAPDPKFLWLGERQRKTFDLLADALFKAGGVALLVGDLGIGKSVLVKAVAQARDDVASFWVGLGDPGLDALDFFSLLALELGMAGPFETRAEFYSRLAHFAPAALGTRSLRLIVVEDAQQLNAEVLAEAVALSRFELDRRPFFKVLLVGQPGIEEVLDRAENQALRQHITTRCRIEPLTEEEIQDYIAHRLAVAGAPSQPFSPQAVQTIARLSKGYPRLINMVCDHALLYGYSAQRDAIDAETVTECSRDLAVALDMDEEPVIEYKVGMISADEAAPQNSASGEAAGTWGMKRVLLAVSAVAVAMLIVYLLLL